MGALMRQIRPVAAVCTVLLLVSGCAGEREPADWIRVTQGTDGSNVLLAQGSYSVTVTGDRVDVPGSRELTCNSTVVIIQVTDGAGETIFEPSGLGDRDRFGKTTGMRFEGRYFNAPNRAGGMDAATQTHISSGGGGHRLDIPETAIYRLWGSSRNNMCKFVFSAKKN
jgi:hypothetical protein